MAWSPEQQLAIQTRNKNILVAAAAGSGKTSVLVERIIRRILDEQQPVDVDALLVVTFTNAAAAEMRARIGAALSDALKANPRSRHIERQMVLLNSATICTIHAFCQSVVRQNFHLLDIDPKFRIAGEAEMTLLKNDVLEELFEEKYSQEDDGFLSFIEHYGNDHNDQPLYSLVLDLYNFSCSHPWPEYWLRDLRTAFAIPEQTGMDDTPWSALIRSKVVLEWEQARRLALQFAAEAARPGNPTAYQNAFLADGMLLNELIAAANHSWERLANALAACQFDKLPAVKGVDEAIKKQFQKHRQSIKDKVHDFRKLFFERPGSELLADMRQIEPLVAALGELTAEFAAAFAAAKRSKGLLDFNDLEHFCLRVLLDEGAGPEHMEPSPVATALQRKYAEIMVDEYQDTNGVQETILSLITRPHAPNLFLVGDVKQSIYRFRLAEPELFLNKYKQYPQLGEGYCRIDLARNFRSRPGILHAVNFLFSQLMVPRVAELEYGEAERLNPGPDYPAAEGLSLAGSVEVHIINKNSEPAASVEEAEQEDEPAGDESEAEDTAELSGFELEARLITRKITELMTSGYQVFDKDSKQYRPLAWRDIVILLRSVKNKADILLEQLRQAAIPVYAELDSGYFREIEVQVMLSLLTVIDNPRQDIPLAGVLRSPLVGLSAAELAEVRLCRENEDLWAAVEALGSPEAEDSSSPEYGLVRKIRAFLARLREWRGLSRRKGVPELIWHIYRTTGYYDYIGGLPGGTLRQANLRALYDRARQYETTNFRGLFRFLRFIERMQDKGSDLAVARTLGESEDIVRIMSIHKSKGLEFPVVFLADLGKNINLSDSQALMLRHKKLGVGPYITNPVLRFRYPSIARYGIAHKLNMETKAEELRILYVALTRAREKLIMVGSTADLAAKAAKWCQTAGEEGTALPDSLIAGAKSYLDWLCPAIARHPGGAELRRLGQCDCEPPLASDPSEWSVTVYRADQLQERQDTNRPDAPLLLPVSKLAAVDAGEDADAIAAVLGWRYPYGEAVGKPAKLSVSEIKRRFDVLEPSDSRRLYERQTIITRPRFMQAGGKMTAAEYGTVMHTVMQHVQPSTGLTLASLQEQLADMVRREILLPEQAETVDVQAVLTFFQSPLGLRCCQSPYLRRELPFSLSLPAERFYPELAGSAETVFVQGVIDALFDEPDGLVLVDYKTDRVHDGNQLKDRYAIQLAVYAEAVETILKQPVKEKYLYVFSTGQVIEV